ncbi:MAG: hypothetical protein EZS28_031301, partial [Streblomastix strix]
IKRVDEQIEEEGDFEDQDISMFNLDRKIDEYEYD